MRLLKVLNGSNFEFTKDFIGDDEIPPYAILSHTWKRDEEVTYKDINDGTSRSKAGYAKIQFCIEKAGRNRLQHVWIDSCCTIQIHH
jgi:hypothetical protein